MVETARRIDEAHGGLRSMRLEVPTEDFAIMRGRALERHIVRSVHLPAVDPVWHAWSVFTDAPLPIDPATLEATARVSLSPPIGPTTTIEVGLPASVGSDQILSFGRSMQSAGAVVSGEAFVTSEGLETLTRDLAIGLGFALLGVLLLFLYLVGSPALALMSLVPNLLPLVAVGGWMGLRGMSLDASSALVFAVAFGLSVDGTIHLLLRHKQMRRRASNVRAVVETMRSSGRAVVIGTLTLAGGFLALLASGFAPLRVFAELSLVAMGAALAAELLLMPGLLLQFGSGNGRRRAP